jgi:hypothetical protein
MTINESSRYRIDDRHRQTTTHGPASTAGRARTRRAEQVEHEINPDAQVVDNLWTDQPWAAQTPVARPEN